MNEGKIVYIMNRIIKFFQREDATVEEIQELIKRLQVIANNKIQLEALKKKDDGLM